VPVAAGDHHEERTRRWLEDRHTGSAPEALGTFTLVFVAFARRARRDRRRRCRILAIAFGFGLALLAGLYAFGEISGGHFNPAVSLGMMLSGRLSPRERY